MGATGSGKSTFINLITGSCFPISRGLRSCTTEVETSRVFYLDGYPIRFIDTPGFDDTSKSDTDILKLIAAFLEASFKGDVKLAGVLYFHRISDIRMGGISTKNFGMFRKLFGDKVLRNVVIVTNRWGEVDPRVGERREAELAGDHLFFKPVLAKGARIARHHGTVPSAEAIIRLILENPPLPLRTQEDLMEDAPKRTIAVMGPTGSGKSTFINLVSGSNLLVSDDIISCTNAVQTAGTFYLDGCRITLVDTPGFDDTTRSDADVLNMIAAFLETSYKEGNILAGILYFHRISDVRVGGISRRNFNMFRKLCGNDALRNVVIVTNMWQCVDPLLGDKREARLRGSDLFFKPALDNGARMARNDNTASSAKGIIRLLINNHPLPLRIQEELVIEGKDITQTSAGEELDRGLAEQIRKYKQEMDEVMKEMREAVSAEDKELKRELEIETQRMEQEIKKFENDRERLESDYKKERERAEARAQQMNLPRNRGFFSLIMEAIDAAFDDA